MTFIKGFIDVVAVDDKGTFHYIHCTGDGSYVEHYRNLSTGEATVFVDDQEYEYKVGENLA